MSHKILLPTSQSNHVTRSQFKLGVTLTLLVAGITIVPMVKAAPLDELSGTLQRTISDVTDQVLNPIEQTPEIVQQTAGEAINQVENQVGDIVNSMTDPLEQGVDIATNQINSFLNPFTQQIQQYLQVFNEVINRSISSIFGDIFGDGSSPWDEQIGGGTPEHLLGVRGDQGFNFPHTLDSNSSHLEVGVLGIPDFESLHEQTLQQATANTTNGAANPQMQQIDQFNTNPQALSQSINSETDRTLNHSMTAAVIGKEGQAAMKQELQAASQTLQAIQSQAKAAQGMDVTQDIMKNLVALQANQSVLTSGTYSNLMLLRQQTAANSLVMNNISAAVDESNRMQHAEKFAGAVSLIQASGNIYLPGSSGN